MKETKADYFFSTYAAEARYTLRANVTECKNIIKILGWNIMPDEKIKIIYEYCPYGSLDRFSDFYRGVSTNRKNKLVEAS